jgi:hypothetical protein
MALAALGVMTNVVPAVASVTCEDPGYGLVCTVTGAGNVVTSDLNAYRLAFEEGAELTVQSGATLTAESVGVSDNQTSQGSESLRVDPGATLVVNDRLSDVGLTNAGRAELAYAEFRNSLTGIINLEGATLTFADSAARIWRGTGQAAVGEPVLVNRGTVVNRSFLEIAGEVANQGTVDNTAGYAVLLGGFDGWTAPGLVTGSGPWQGSGDHALWAEVEQPTAFDQDQFDRESYNWYLGALSEECQAALALTVDPPARELPYSDGVYWNMVASQGAQGVATAPASCVSEEQRYEFDHWGWNAGGLDFEPVSDSPQYTFSVERGVRLFAFYRVAGSDPSPSAPPGPSAPGPSPSQGAGGPTPSQSVAPAESELTEANRDGLGVPSTAPRGSEIAIAIEGARAGERVSVYLFSDPVLLGQPTVADNGTVEVALPASISGDRHRIAVYAADGSLIGWDWITLTGGGSGGPSASASGSGTALPVSGASVLPLSLLGVLLIGGGAGLVCRRRALMR